MSRKERKTNRNIKKKGVVKAPGGRQWRNRHVLKDGSIITLGFWDTETEAIKWSYYYDNLLEEKGLLK